MTTRLLFVDDSGKPDSNHPSKAVVIGGFAVDAGMYPALSRRILGAKRRFFPRRGQPQTWEIKSSDYIKPNPWKRAANRQFCFEIARILGAAGATAFTASLDKSKLKHPMGLTTSMPLQLQCLVEHLDIECRARGCVGIVVSDWPKHHLDHHASRCVASFVASKKLRIHPSVYYASSHSNEGVQVADLISAVRRRCVEGDASLHTLCTVLHGHCQTNGGITVKNRQFTNRITVI